MRKIKTVDELVEIMGSLTEEIRKLPGTTELSGALFKPITDTTSNRLESIQMIEEIIVVLSNHGYMIEDPLSP